MHELHIIIEQAWTDRAKLPSADGKYSLYCAGIVMRVDARTRAETGINKLLPD